MMTELSIKLDTIVHVKDFVNLVYRYPNDLDLVSGRYTIDAKSIMGIFSLDLSQPLTLCIHGDASNELLAELKPYIVSQ